jgi:hypothetical protein
MEKWVPATKADVLEQIEDEKRTTPPSVWAELAHMLCEPYATTIFRFGETEVAFVVGKSRSRVVYLDDVEYIFCTATEIDGRLVDDQAWDNGSLSVALRQAALGL